MNRFYLFLLWLIACATDCEITIRGIMQGEDTGDVEDDSTNYESSVDWLEYLYAISDDCPEGNSTPESDQAGSI